MDEELMAQREVVSILIVIVGATMLLILIERLRRKKPCWLFRHAFNHLSIERRCWTSGSCPNPCHAYHGPQKICYITKWVCTRCPEMGYYCVGEADKGAWTIQHGKIVPDEKQWSQWS